MLIATLYSNEIKPTTTAHMGKISQNNNELKKSDTKRNHTILIPFI